MPLMLAARPPLELPTFSEDGSESGYAVMIGSDESRPTAARLCEFTLSQSACRHRTPDGVTGGRSRDPRGQARYPMPVLLLRAW